MANSSEAKTSPELQEQNQPEIREATRLRAVGVRHAQDAGSIGQKAAEAVVDTIAEATVQTAEAAAQATSEMTVRTADLGQEVTREGLEAATSAMTSLADASADQGRRLLETATRVTDVYGDAAKRAADDLQALVGVYTNMGRGLRQYRQTYLDLLRGSMASTARKQLDLILVKSPVAFAEVQRDIYLDGVNNLLTGNTTLLELVRKITEEALQPLQERTQAQG